jgi:cytochrome P450
MDVREQSFDHHAPDHVETMRTRFADLRRHCPVMHSDTYGGFWVVSRYQDVYRALQDHRTFSSASGITIPPIAHGRPSYPTASDEPDHTHYRRALWPFLTPAAVAGYETIVRETVTGLINDFIATGRADVLEQLAKPVPAFVTGRFFGFSAEEGRQIYDLLEALFTHSAAGDLEGARAVDRELTQLLQGSLDAARRDPGDNVSSALVTYEHEGRTFDNDECLGLLTTSIAGALSTTVGAIGHAVHLLWLHPSERRKIVQRPELAVHAVEEVLRMDSPAHALARTLHRPCEIDGVTIQSGERVLLLVDSANHDEGAFEAPDEFRVDRPNNTHLTFGHGIHKCEGQHLARLELRVVIEELVRRIPEYEVVGTPVISSRGGVLAPTDLHIAFPPGTPEPLS